MQRSPTWGNYSAAATRCHEERLNSKSLVGEIFQGLPSRWYFLRQKAIKAVRVSLDHLFWQSTLATDFQAGKHPNQALPSWLFQRFPATAAAAGRCPLWRSFSGL